MDDSDQDFVDFCCSKLPKRVRKKACEPTRQTRKAEQQQQQQALSQAVQGDRRRKKKQADDAGAQFAATQPAGAEAERQLVTSDSRESSALPSDHGAQTDRDLSAKDKVLLKMQHFKRASPQKMLQNVNVQPTKQDIWTLTAQHQIQESDEALALQLQQQLDREAAEAQTVDLEDGGLFFCQICHRDVSHMTPEGRTQHLNRCLDKSEESGPAPPPATVVLDCPICGKKFKSQKSRLSHLKRCSADMGVSPAEMLQVLQRQAQESQSAATANTHFQSGVKKRKGPPKSGVPARKKPRNEAEPLDEETMVALALSCSVVEQEKKAGKHLQTECVPSHSSTNPVLKWRPDPGKERGKKKRGVAPPPPLLLIQDARTTLARLQERVSALLLRSRAPSPPTPTRCPSSLPSWTGAALLWQRSALLDEDSTCPPDFYAAELKPFFTSLESVKTAAPSTTSNKSEPFDQPVSEGTPASGPRASVPASCSQTASCSSASSTPGAWQLSVGSQALRDLMELAEDGMTLTQYGYTSKENHLSDIKQEESEHQAKLGVSGFLPETTHKPSDEPLRQGERSTNQPEADSGRNRHGSVALSSLVSDLSSMVNNPQLSDVQLQVDSGEVYFAHSFMVYARCPLLAEMVHESGIGVKEEDMPGAQRVLLSDVPGQAVFALLQFLYTARCSIPTPLQPHMLELASRFDLQELEQLCHLQQEKANDVGDEVLDTNQEENANNQTDQAFMELLQSMWNGEDEEATDSDGGEVGGQMEEARPDEVTSGDRELCEEQVNEEELEEIYEFAATQKKKEQDSEEQEEDEEVEEGERDDAMLTIERLGDKPDPDLDCNYSRLFSQSWEEDNSSLTSKPVNTAKTHPVQSKQHQSPQKPSSKQSSRTLFHSSESLADDLSVSPLLCTSSLPVPGLSPGHSREQEDGGARRKDSVRSDVPAKQQGQVPVSICVSPDSPPKQKEPELIVLSDSGEETEVNAAVLKPCRLLADSSSTQNLQSYTEIKSRQDPTSSEHKEPSNMESHPDDPPDCSPEISWLIPSTPLQSDRSTRSSSTQTKSSLCRTQLFPKVESSPPSSSVFSSPALTFNNKRHTSSKPPAESACATESSVSRLNSNVSPLSSSDREASHRNSSDVRKTRVNSSQLPRFPSLTRQHSLSAVSQQHSRQLQQHPCSSSPLDTELHQPPSPPSASPLHTDTDRKTSSQRRERAPSQNTETELGSLHLSPSDPPSSSSHSGCQQSRRKSSSLSRRSAECSSGDDTRDRLHRLEHCMTEEADAGEVSFQQSFMDEPPIAFNDSWGLGANAEFSPGRFSLRLEGGEGSNLQQSSSRRETSRSSSSTSCPAPDDRVQTGAKRGGAAAAPLPQCRIPQRSKNLPSPPPEPSTRTTPERDNRVLDSKLWDSWVEDEEGESLPLSQRVTARLKTPALQNKKRRCVVPITPMPHYSDMDTPELKNKLSRFGVRPLPKRQMVLKLKEIHQYTHQLASSDSEGEAPQKKSPSSRRVSCAQMATFREPQAPAAVSPVKTEEGEVLSASQGSNTSSTAASEESESRSNPELLLSSDGDSDSDGSISSSQAAAGLQDRLTAVRSFILSDSSLYSQILQYQPLVLSQFQTQLKAAGIRLGAPKLMDYLDSQCITFTTAKPGHSAASKGRRGRKTSKGPRAARGKHNVVKLN